MFEAACACACVLVQDVTLGRLVRFFTTGPAAYTNRDSVLLIKSSSSRLDSFDLVGFGPDVQWLLTRQPRLGLGSWRYLVPGDLALGDTRHFSTGTPLTAAFPLGGTCLALRLPRGTTSSSTSVDVDQK